MKHIDKVFKEKLYDHQTTVPEGMWDKIAPALEEKSSRSLLWLWVSGLAALLIGGLIFMLSFNNPSNTPLTEVVRTTQKQNSSEAVAPVTSLIEEVTKNTIEPSQVSAPMTKEVNTQSIASAANKTTLVSTTSNTSAASTTVKISMLTEQSPLNKPTEIVVINDEIKYGKPANLVITKSYINDNGSLVKQSNITADSDVPSPVYNVFINSEGLNAGALLRIIQPIEKMPLPAFLAQKKKITI